MIGFDNNEVEKVIQCDLSADQQAQREAALALYNQQYAAIQQQIADANAQLDNIKQQIQVHNDLLNQQFTTEMLNQQNTAAALQLQIAALQSQLDALNTEIANRKLQRSGIMAGLDQRKQAVVDGEHEHGRMGKIIADIQAQLKKDQDALEAEKLLFAQEKQAYEQNYAQRMSELDSRESILLQREKQIAGSLQQINRLGR